MNKLILCEKPKAESLKQRAKGGKQKAKNTLAFYLLPFSFLLILSSCGDNGTSLHKTIFNINLDEGLTSLDPAFCRNQNTI